MDPWPKRDLLEAEQVRLRGGDLIGEQLASTLDFRAIDHLTQYVVGVAQVEHSLLARAVKGRTDRPVEIPPNVEITTHHGHVLQHAGMRLRDRRRC
jgi:hypothetical protein